MPVDLFRIDRGSWHLQRRGPFLPAKKETRRKKLHGDAAVGKSHGTEHSEYTPTLASLRFTRYPSLLLLHPVTEEDDAARLQSTFTLEEEKLAVITCDDASLLARVPFINISGDRARDTPLTIACNDCYNSRYPSGALACHRKNVTCVPRIHVPARHSYARSHTAPFTLTTAREMPAHPLDPSSRIVPPILDS